MMTHGSLFSGMGGFDLAAEWVGWKNSFHCEWNSFGQRILKYYWPNAKSYTDITKTDFSIHRGTIDVLTGGFPCQPYSMAGKRKGKDDERHLWPHMLRAISEIQPGYVVGENVPGLVNWNGGLVFEEVQTDLETQGYEITPFILPACGIDAPHRRDRIWFIAYSSSYGHQRRELRKNRSTKSEGKSEGDQWKRVWSNAYGTGQPWNVANANSQGFTERFFSGQQSIRETKTTIKRREFTRTHTAGDWSEFPTQPPVCDGNDGLSSRLDGITFSKWRNESIKAGGNAIVPQLAHQILKSIQNFENLCG